MGHCWNKAASKLSLRLPSKAVGCQLAVSAAADENHGLVIQNRYSNSDSILDRNVISISIVKIVRALNHRQKQN